MFSTSTQGMLSINDIILIISTTTSNFYDYFKGIIGYLLVFGVIVGTVFWGIRWIWSAITGHGMRH